MPTELNTENAFAPTNTTPETTEVSAPAEQEPKGSWLHRLLRGGAEPEPVSAEPEEEPTPAKAESPESGEPARPAPFKTFASEDELQRFIQAEVDREEARRTQVRQERAKKERWTQLAENDPVQLAQEILKQKDEDTVAEEQATKFAELSKSVVDKFDQMLLDPLVLALPEDTRKELVSKAPPALEGREWLVKEAIKAIREDAEKAAETRLRKNKAFHKELLRELQDQVEEPELAPAAPSGPPASTGAGWMDRAIRGAFGRA